jgi:hypothetical protein
VKTADTKYLVGTRSECLCRSMRRFAFCWQCKSLTMLAGESSSTPARFAFKHLIFLSKLLVGQSCANLSSDEGAGGDGRGVTLYARLVAALSGGSQHCHLTATDVEAADVPATIGLLASDLPTATARRVSSSRQVIRRFSEEQRLLAKSFRTSLLSRLTCVLVSRSSIFPVPRCDLRRQSL